MVYIGIKYQMFNTIWYLLIAKYFNNYYLINNYELMIQILNIIKDLYKISKVHINNV